MDVRRRAARCEVRRRTGSGLEVSTKKRRNWGGFRPGAGRPKGSGNGSSPDSRRNRIALMLTDAELEKLASLARLEGRPVATLAYEILRAGLLGRMRRRKAREDPATGAAGS